MSKALNTFHVFRPRDLKLRSIVGGHKCPTKRLNLFVDITRKPLLSKIKNYVKDDFEFLKKYKKT